MKANKILLIVAMLIFILGLTACKKDNNDGNDTPNDLDADKTISEIYQDIEMYENRLNDLTDNDLIESDSYVAPIGTRMSSTTIEYDIYTREQLNDRLQTYTPAQIESRYMENLFDAKVFVSRIKELIFDDLYQKFGVEFNPDPDNLDLTYTFLTGREGYLIIDANNGIENRFIKIGMSDDKLEYSELLYSQEDFNPSLMSETELSYNYFRFIEDKEAVYVNQYDSSHILSYTSIEEDMYFTIQSTNDLEFNGGEDGYHINYYDNEELLQVFITVVDNQVVSEVYDVMTENGLLYRYEDTDISDSSIKLATNFIEATGYDYVKVASSGYFEEEEGVYKNGGTPVYVGFLNFTYNPLYAFASVKQNITKELLTDEHFDLNSLGMNLDHTRASLSYFNSIQINDIETVKQHFTVNGIDFFGSTLEEDLYNFLDIDIRASIEGTNIPSIPDNPDDPINTDDGTFLVAAMDLFEDEFESYGLLRTEQVSTLGTSEVLGKTYIDNDLHYLYFYRYIMGGGPSKRYAVYPYDNSIIELIGSNNVYEAETIFEDDTDQNFKQLVTSDNNIYDPLTGIDTVTKVSDTEFDVTGDYRILGYENQFLFADNDRAYSNFLDSTVTATIKFTADYKTMTIEFDVAGIVRYSSSEEVPFSGTIANTLEEFDHYYPMDNELARCNFSETIEDIIFPTEVDTFTVTSLSLETRYTKIYLEPGIYELDHNINGDSLTFELMNSDQQTVTYSEVFEIDNSGMYYIRVTNQSYTSDGLRFVIKKLDVEPSSIITLDPNQTSVSIQLTEDTFSYIKIPKEDSDKLLKLSLLDVGLSEEMGEYLGVGLMPHNPYSGGVDADSYPEAYLYIQANSYYLLRFYTNIAGTYTLYYQYEDVPTSESKITDININDLTEHPDIFLNQYQNEVKVHFTISQSSTYNMDVDYQFYSVKYACELYTSDGVLVEDFRLRRTFAFEPGDYYLLYTIYNEDTEIMTLTDYTLRVEK
ncbi:hypothetical protein KQ51_00744 [Candidatus Izimaplasma bacterium HR1]|jgi:hypothetical protein|uniref:hypothetical protein n=1 Tax=Candidatus Izimoplasma sp. HR1 TaxID=1541959 RepID=UPI0004F73BAA|nr:hypothetical protein KQ51_00744 [Candidatus Izimaplasma bacterium HR1]